MTSGKASRETREAKAAQRRAAAAQAESRRKNSIRIGIAVVVVLVVVGFGALIQSQRSGTSGGDSSAVPANTSGTANAVITVGKADAPVTVTMYEDFQCPACKAFEEASESTLSSYVDKGTVKLEYHPIAFLDRASSTNYSTRSLNAAACVVNSTPSAYQKLHNLLYANQPAEGSAGLPDAKLIELAQQAGAGDVSACIKDQQFKGWTAAVTDQASKDNVNSTPTVKVNDQLIANPTPQSLTAAIDAAAK